MKKKLRYIFCTLIFTITPSLLFAEIDPRIPDALTPWIPWVTATFPEHDCAIRFTSIASKTCIWPTGLTLTANKTGLDFSGRWHVDRKGFLQIPGETNHWPMDLKVDGVNAQVLSQNNLPNVHAAKGNHVISGRISWEDIPSSLQIPSSSGLITLAINGKLVPQPRLDNDGKLWLEQQVKELPEVAENFVKTTINRKIIDGIPLKMEIAINLAVSGKAREYVMQDLFDQHFLATEVSSALPSKLDSSGRLTVQLRPGSWQVLIETRHLGPVVDLPFMVNDSDQNREEIWVFAADDKLRTVQITGAQSVDPNQTQLPQDWKKYPAFHMKAGLALHLEQGKRGDESPPPDELALQREQWLDFSGHGYTIKDTIGGTLKRNWRINMAKPTILEQASVNDESQLITKTGDTDSSGIELRQGKVQVVTVSRLESRDFSMPATSWSHTFSSVSSTLHLPPGWSVFAAFGADDVSPTWLGKWTNWGNFLLIALLAFSVSKLFSVRLGVITFCALFLTLPDADAPKYLWLILLAPIGLLRILPDGRLRTLVSLWKYTAAAFMILTASTFLFARIRTGLYPQLESPSAEIGIAEDDIANQERKLTDVMETFGSRQMSPPPKAKKMEKLAQAPMEEREEDLREAEADMITSEGGSSAAANDGVVPVAPSAMAVIPKPSPTGFPQKGIRQPLLLEKAPIPGSTLPNSDAHQTYNDLDPTAIIQTGPGLPSWHWSAVQLSWKGPVEAGQNLTVLYLSPWMNLALALLETLMIGYLLAQLLKPKDGFSGLASGNFSNLSTTIVIMLFGLGLMLNAGSAFADFPPESVLKKLGEMINEPPVCLPECASIPRVSIDFTPVEIKIRVEIHTLEHVAVPLPIDVKLWNPSTIELDGKPAGELIRDSGQVLWIGLSPGIHQILIAGPTAHLETMQIPFLLLPHHVSSTGTGWSVDGIHENGLPDGSLTLHRTSLTKNSNKKGSEIDSSFDLPSFVKVERRLRLGKKWQATTVITSLTPINSGISLKIPLLPGESVTTASIHVKDRLALVNLNPQSTQVVWESVLEPTAELILTAPMTNDWIEEWTVRPSQTWSFTQTGIPPITRVDQEQYYQPLWLPWAGESVTLKFTRPEAAIGESTTIESVNLTSSPGDRLTDSNLAIKINSSRGTEKTITIPDGSELLSINIDGLEKTLTANQTQIRIPILPGSQLVTIRWRLSKNLGTIFRTDKVTIEGVSANFHARVNFPNRWILFLGGPGSGPVVLFWSRILLILAFASLASKLTQSPLKFHDWLLLGLGFAASSIESALVFFGFLIVLNLRRKHTPGPLAWKFNVQQLLLAGWGIAAATVLVYAVNTGFIGSPDMQIIGNGSSQSSLSWYLDRIGQELPQAWVLSFPIYIFQAFTFIWAMWVAYSMTKWLPWAWNCFSEGGYWKKSDIDSNSKKSSWMLQFSRDRKGNRKDHGSENIAKGDGTKN